MSLQHEALHGHPTGWRGVQHHSGVRPAVAVAAVPRLPVEPHGPPPHRHHRPAVRPRVVLPAARRLGVGQCGQAGVHPRHANHDRAPDHRIDSQHLPVPVARVAHDHDPAVRLLADGRRILWRQPCWLVAVRRRRRSLSGSTSLGFVVDGPVVHPAAFVRRALRSRRRHQVGCGQGRAGDVADVPQQQPPPHASRRAVDTVVRAARAASPAWRPTRSPPRAPACIAMDTSKWRGETSSGRSANPIIHCRREHARSAPEVFDDHRLAGDVSVPTTAIRLRRTVGRRTIAGCHSRRPRWTGSSIPDVACRRDDLLLGQTCGWPLVKHLASTRSAWSARSTATWTARSTARTARCSSAASTTRCRTSWAAPTFVSPPTAPTAFSGWISLLSAAAAHGVASRRRRVDRGRTRPASKPLRTGRCHLAAIDAVTWAPSGRAGADGGRQRTTHPVPAAGHGWLVDRRRARPSCEPRCAQRSATLRWPQCATTLKIRDFVERDLADYEGVSALAELG